MIIAVATTKYYPAIHKPRILVGYKLQLNKDCALVGKVGGSMRFFTREYSRPYSVQINYFTDNFSDLRILGVKDQIMLSQNNDFYSTRNAQFADIYLLSYEGYIGASRTLTHKWIKNVTAGIESSRVANKYNSKDFINSFVIEVHENNASTQRSRDWYIDRNLFIGLRVGVGLWK